MKTQWLLRGFVAAVAAASLGAESANQPPCNDAQVFGGDVVSEQQSRRFRIVHLRGAVIGAPGLRIRGTHGEAHYDETLSSLSPRYIEVWGGVSVEGNVEGFHLLGSADRVRFIPRFGRLTLVGRANATLQWHSGSRVDRGEELSYTVCRGSNDPAA
jgi:hypothetical protein